MVIIVGLGNPGKKFEKTRHNVGFMVIDEFRKKNNFPEFACLPAGRNWKKNPIALISQKENILLVKPQTFMNDSGKSVRAITKPYTLNPKPLLVVIHDDIDLSVGKIKIIKERGSAGHKGVESIIENIGNEGLVRFRIGIKSEDTITKKQDTKTLVLKNFSKEEQEIINETIQKAVDALDLFVKEGLDRTMNKFN